MKLVSFSTADGKVRPGALIEEGKSVVDLSGKFADALGVIAAGVQSLDGAADYPRHRVDSVRLHAPLSNPPRVFAIGLKLSGSRDRIGHGNPQDAGRLFQTDNVDHRSRREHRSAKELNAA